MPWAEPEAGGTPSLRPAAAPGLRREGAPALRVPLSRPCLSQSFCLCCTVFIIIPSPFCSGLGFKL